MNNFDYWNLLYVVAGAVLTWLWNQLQKNSQPVNPNPVPVPVNPTPVNPAPVNPTPNPVPVDDPMKQFLIDLINQLLSKVHPVQPVVPVSKDVPVETKLPQPK